MKFHSVDVTALTGERVDGPLASWQTDRGEHLAGRNPDGELIVWTWTLDKGWQAENVTRQTRSPRLAGPVTACQGVKARAEQEIGKEQQVRTKQQNGEQKYGEQRYGEQKYGEQKYGEQKYGEQQYREQQYREQQYRGGQQIGSVHTIDNSVTVEYLAGVGVGGELVVYFRSRDVSGGAWLYQNVTAQAGRRVVGEVAGWVMYLVYGEQGKGLVKSVEYPMGGGETVSVQVAAVGADGEVLVSFQSAGSPWNVIDVSSSTKRTVGTHGVTAWLGRDRDFVTTNLAAVTEGDELVVFDFTPFHAWNTTNVTALTGKKVKSLVTPAGDSLAGMGPGNEFLIWHRSERGEWHVENVTQATGAQIIGRPAHLAPGIYFAEGIDASLLLFHGNESQAVHRHRILSHPTAWRSHGVIQVAAEGVEHRLRVFWCEDRVV